MRTRHGALLGSALLLATACATTTPPRTEFSDVPVPDGLAYQADRSATIESPTVRAARQVYRSRLEPDSLTAAIRAALEANGWRHVSGTSTRGTGWVQLYQKGDDTLHVRVWEGGLFGWYTYVEYAAARVAPGAVRAAAR